MEIFIWSEFFILSLLMCIKLKSDNKMDIDGKTPKYKKLQEWSLIILVFCGAVGIIRNIDIFNSIASPLLTVQWLLSIIGLILQVRALDLRKNEEDKK